MNYCDKRDQFCFLCGKFTADKMAKKKNGAFQGWLDGYYEMFWSNEAHVPQIVCSSCYLSVSRWNDRKHPKPKYKFPIGWLNPGEHNEAECYFCVNTVRGANTAKRSLMEYKSTRNTVLPIEHNMHSPPRHVPGEQRQYVDAIAVLDAEFAMEVDLEAGTEQQPSGSEYVPTEEINTAPVLINQSCLNNMCRRLELSQRKSEMLASMLKDNNLLDASVKITSQRNRQATFIPYFQSEIISENELSF